MNKDIIHLTEKAWAIEVPENAHGFKIVNSDNNMGQALFFFVGVGLDFKRLPEGTWSILGLSSDLTEDQWMEVVEKYHLQEKYKDYFTQPNSDLCAAFCPVFSTAKESGYSLLKSLSLDPDTTLILIKQ